MLGSDSPEHARAGEATGGAFLDSALFTQVKGSRDVETCAAAWLEVQTRIIAGLRHALVVLGAPGRGPFAPVAVWPKGAVGSRALLGATETAVGTQRLVLQSGKAGRAAEDGATTAIAYPITVNGQVCGAAAIEIEPSPDTDVRLAMDQLEWGCGWLEALIRRRRVTSTDRLVTVIELLATSLHFDRFQSAATGVATELAGALNCERVSIGFVRGRHAKVCALSHSAAFARKANLIRAIEAAMDEAIDQQAVMVFPAPSDSPDRVMRAHAELQRDHQTGPICTVPLPEGQRLLGAMTLERPVGEPFDAETVQLCEHVALLVGPVLDIKRKEDRWLPQKIWDSASTTLGKLIGPRHVALKLGAIATVALIAFMALATGDFRITADATLEGTVQRAVAAPIAGYLAEADVRAGDIVRRGQVLAMLDDRDLRLEKLKWDSERAKQLREYSEAMAKHERAQTRILRTQIEQAEAQIALLDEQLARLRITAPFDGFIVSGDLSQALGAPVERGDVLFEVAPLHAYRVILEVDERDIGDIRLRQPGILALSGLPDESLAIEVEKITPISSVKEGRNYFRVEAQLAGEPSAALRPGMEGIGKIHVDRRRLIWIWSYKVIHWLRMFVWTWWP
jgi:RND family efflux transporter MFP subunit